MESYPNRPLPVRPRPKPIADMTDQELTELLTKSRSYGDLIPGLIESPIHVSKISHFLEKHPKSIFPTSLHNVGKINLFHGKFPYLTKICIFSHLVTTYPFFFIKKQVAQQNILIRETVIFWEHIYKRMTTEENSRMH